MPFVLGCPSCRTFPVGNVAFGDKCGCGAPLRAWMLAPECFTPKEGLVPVQVSADSPLRASGLSDRIDMEELAYQCWARFADHEIVGGEEVTRAEWPCFNADRWRENVADAIDAARVPLHEGAGEPTDGVSLIRAERQRQISSEGWTPEHDDTHAHGEMALAAACYAWPNPRPVAVKRAWPWDRAWWKPAIPGDRIGFPELHTPEEITTARIKDLRRAGALIAAEIDRLRRAAPDPVHQEPADGE